MIIRNYLPFAKKMREKRLKKAQREAAAALKNKGKKKFGKKKVAKKVEEPPKPTRTGSIKTIE